MGAVVCGKGLELSVLLIDLKKGKGAGNGIQQQIANDVFNPIYVMKPP